MSNPPDLQLGKPRHRRKRREFVATPLPPGPPIHVEGVNTADPPSAGFCVWFFDSDVTVSGAVTGLLVNIDGGWREPINAVQGDVNSIACYYDTEQTLDGYAYQIEGTPTGILQAARIQDANGTVEAP